MTNSQHCACTALRKASRAVTRLYDQRLCASGMTITQFAILRNLAREGSLPLSRLAELLVMERTSLYRALDPLERRGWVAVGPGNSGPTKVAEVTEAGLQSMTEATPEWQAAQNEILSVLGVTEFKALEMQLNRLVALSSGAIN